MPGPSEIFSLRLKELCRLKSSYAQVARELNINRQQFSRYVNGASIPRRGLLEKIARYFNIRAADFFTETPLIIHSDSASGNHLSALFGLILQANTANATDLDIEPGFYRQYKLSFRFQSTILMSLVLVYKKNGVYYYKRRISKSAQKLLDGPIYDVLNGVFFRQGRYLMLVDVGTMLGELTFHTMKIPRYPDRNFFPGVHMTAGNADRVPNRPSRFVLEKLKPGESVLAVARAQGRADLNTASRQVRYTFASYLADTM